MVLNKNMGNFRPMMSSEQKKKIEDSKNRIEKAMVDDSPFGGYYPEQIRFTSEQLPEIKKWEVGKEYEITLKVTMKSYEMEKKENRGSREHARFEIVAVKPESGGMDKKQKEVMEFMTK